MAKNPIKFVHVWVGNFDGTKREFDACFDLKSYYKAKDDEPFEPCAFSKYLGVPGYSEDIFGRWFERKGIEKLLAEMNFPKRSHSAIEKACAANGIETANAAIIYSVFLLEDATGLEDYFMGLKYLGEFKN